MRVLLFGGTFDPPHNGHMHNLRAAIEAVRPDHAIVMPAGTPPHKAPSGTSAALRLAMCRCFLAVDPAVEVSDWEVCRPGPSYTVDTLAMLRERWPEAALYLCIGSDMLLTFTRWRQWRRILRLAALVVQSRQGGDDAALRAAAAALEREGGRILFTSAPALPCASHELRAALRAGTLDAAAAAAQLPNPVPAIIARYGLYAADKGGNASDL